MKNNSIVAGIVLFNPDVKRLDDVIASIYNQVDKIIFVDNKSENIREIEAILRNYSRVKIVKNKRNMGIAKALNQIFEVAKKEHYNFVITLDHDTICPTNMVDSYISVLKKTKAGLICPNVVDQEIVNNKYYSNQRIEYEPITECIQTGCMIAIDAWQKSGGFAEELFIDFVDFDFCKKLNILNIPMFRANNVVVDHELGHRKKTNLSFLFDKLYQKSGIKAFKYLTYRNVFSATRSFYTARNNYIYIKKFENYIDVKQETKKMQKRILKRIIRGVNPIMILKESYRGFKSAKNMHIKEYIKIQN